jgi:RimJ/RimL family protein N-acetyltransferase
MEWSGPAYRIETTRTRLCCLEPKHTEALGRAIDESLGHLRPWMAWTMHEPVPFEQRLERMRTSRGHFDLGSDYTYAVLDKPSETLIGVIGLKLGPDLGERELGYWLHVAWVGRGLAFEAAQALVRVGFEVEALANIDLRTDPENLRSANLARKLGFQGPVLDPLSAPDPEGGKRDTHVYSLSRLHYAVSPARTLAVEAFDVLERPLRLAR